MIRPIFGRSGVTWSVYRTLRESLAYEPRLFADNSILSGVAHAGGATYPTPDAAAHILSDEPRPAAATPRICEHNDVLLATLLGMSEGEIARLHDAGLVA